MRNKRFKNLMLIILIIAGITALTIQLAVAIARAADVPVSITENVVRYFSFFTIQSNILITVCAFCILLAQRVNRENFFSFPKVISAIAVYIIIVGLVYNLMLRKLYHLYGPERFANELLHVFIPVIFMVYWAVYVPKKALSWNVFPWLIYPLSYGVYTLIRGAFVDHYPYPFLNVTRLGYPGVLLSFGFLLIAFLVVSLLLVGTGKLIARRHDQ